MLSLVEEAEMAAKSVKDGRIPSIFLEVRLRLKGWDERYVVASSESRFCSRSSSSVFVVAATISYMSEPGHITYKAV
jgi:hypothetical protein